jgi:hypothetical protein
MPFLPASRRGVSWHVFHEIIHSFFNQNIARIVDPASRPAVLKELKNLRNSVLEGDRATRQILECLYALRGIDFNNIALDVETEKG